MGLQTKKVDGGSGVGIFNIAYYIPDGTPSSSKLPVFVFIPGSGETGTDVTKLYINGPLKFIQSGSWKPPFVVIGAQTPYSWGMGWQTDPIFMRAVMKEVVSGGYPIDPSQIVLTGLSYGASHVMNYMQFEKSAAFIKPLAAIPMSISCYGSGGSYPTDYLAGNDSRFADTSLWGFCGTLDSFYPAMSRFFTVLLKGAGYYFSFTPYSGGHGGWNTFYDPSYKNAVGQSIYDWALQTVPKTTTTTSTSSTTTSSSTTTTTTKEFITSVQITYSSGRIVTQS